jgi:hypothetical protein
LGGASGKSLNEDPYNLRAEELAVEQCKAHAAGAAGIRKEWSESQMVRNFGGAMVPGTPDGMFEDMAGSLTCVQVVRVPFRPEMGPDEVATTLYETVLAKVVKSQMWIKSTGIVPKDFVIFCWLPPVGAFEVCMKESEEMLWTEALIWNVRAGGWPFSLKLVVPEEPETLFPIHFGWGHERRVRKDYLGALSFLLNLSDFEEDEEDEVEWDLFACDEEDLMTEEEDVDMVCREIAAEEEESLATAAEVYRLLILCIRSIESQMHAEAPSTWQASCNLANGAKDDGARVVGEGPTPKDGEKPSASFAHDLIKASPKQKSTPPVLLRICGLPWWGNHEFYAHAQEFIWCMIGLDLIRRSHDPYARSGSSASAWLSEISHGTNDGGLLWCPHLVVSCC